MKLIWRPWTRPILHRKESQLYVTLLSALSSAQVVEAQKEVSAFSQRHSPFKHPTVGPACGQDHATMLNLPARPRDVCDDSAPRGGNMNDVAVTLILFDVAKPLTGVHALCRG